MGDTTFCRCLQGANGLFQMQVIANVKCWNPIKVCKTSTVRVLMQRLAIKSTSPSDNVNYSGLLERVRLAVRVVPPSDVSIFSVFEALGARRHVSPASSGAMPGDNAEIMPLICLLRVCVVYKALVILQRSPCWCFLSCGSERIP